MVQAQMFRGWVQNILEINSDYILQEGDNKMNELYHYGVLGMRWGVRRFQNKDGSLTSAGKRRFKSVESNEKKT